MQQTLTSEHEPTVAVGVHQPQPRQSWREPVVTTGSHAIENCKQLIQRKRGVLFVNESIEVHPVAGNRKPVFHDITTAPVSQLGTVEWRSPNHCDVIARQIEPEPGWVLRQQNNAARQLGQRPYNA